nr:hypothetical protein [Tanacetum cinerariifolium]
MANEEENHALVADYEALTEFTLMAKSSSSFEKEVYDDSYYSKSCRKNTKNLNTKISKLNEELSDFENNLYHYKIGLSQVEAGLVNSKTQEIKLCQKIRGLERDVEVRNNKIEYLMNELEHVKKEKEGLDNKLTCFESSLKDLDTLLGSQRTDKNKEGLGYNAIPLLLLKSTHLLRRIFLGQDCLNLLMTLLLTLHMTGNISYLSEYEPYNGGYVSFRQEGGKITGKDFKLKDDTNVLLKTPRRNNMYSIDLNNCVPHKNLTCLVAQASVDESMLWHRRLGHLNFKTMNKLVRNNLVKGLPSKCFENDHTCVACLKGKQHKASCKTKFTWTFFLRTKDETSGILRNFITEIENLKDLKVKIIRTPAIEFLRPFGCHVMILNTFDHLGKSDAKGDKDYFVRYALTISPTVYVSHIRQFWSTARIETTNEETKILAIVVDDHASLLRDDNQGEAFPTISSLDAGHDMENINKTSSLPHESSSRVTSLDANEGTQYLMIYGLKARVKLLEDKDRGSIEPSQEDAPIKGGKAANILTSGVAAVSVSHVAAATTVSVHTVNGLFSTVSAIFTAASVVTPYSRRPREISTKDKEEEFARDNQRLSEQLAIDSEIARLHAEEELKMMIEGLDRSNEMIAKHLQEYEQAAADLSIREKIELINEMVKYQDHHAKILKYLAQQSKPLSKKGMTLEEIKEKFIPVWKQFKDFVSMSSKEEAERVKKNGLKLEQGSAKKIKTSEDVSEEDLKGMMQLVPLEEVYVEAL